MHRSPNEGGSPVHLVDQIKVFVRVVELGSFSKASEDFGITKSSVSAAVSHLEATVGARLLSRTTRKVAATEAGEAFYARAIGLLNQVADVEHFFAKDEPSPRGKLRVDVPSRVGRRVLLPSLPQFFETYPNIELELRISDRPIDLIEAGVDCVLRLGPLSDSELIARRLGSMEQVTCASPAYIARHGRPGRLEDLKDHYAVNYVSPHTGRPVPLLFREDGAIRSIEMRSRLSVNNVDAYITGGLEGVGLVQMPARDAEAYVQAGRIVPILDEISPPPIDISLLYPHRAHLSPQLAAFIDWSVKIFRGAWSG